LRQGRRHCQGQQFGTEAGAAPVDILRDRDWPRDLDTALVLVADECDIDVERTSCERRDAVPADHDIRMQTGRNQDLTERDSVVQHQADALVQQRKETRKGFRRLGGRRHVPQIDQELARIELIDDDHPE